MRPSWMFIALCLSIAGCNGKGGGSTTQPPATIAVAPMCVLVGVTSAQNPQSDTPLISERTSTTTPHGFVRMHSTTGQRGNTTPPGTRNDVYAFTEGWLRNASAPLVWRAQAHPAPLAGAPQGTNTASAWTVSSQDAMGNWTGPMSFGTANRGFAEVDTLAAAAKTVPQLMPVGVATSQMFACAGARTMDDTARTTSLFELRLPNPQQNVRTVTFVQDLVWGDDRFVPNQTGGPLIGPANPPTPTLRSPGPQARDGSVKCAMTQFEDDVATRELHMLAIDNGVLYHSMASNFGANTTGFGERFRAVSPFADVSVPLGRTFGTIVAASIVGRPRMVSVFFVARGADGMYRLFHTVRQSPGGGWRPADDVFALTGTPSSATPFDVAAGECPLFGEEATGATGSSTELVYVAYKPDRTMLGGRVVSTPRQWSNSPLNGVWSPLVDMNANGAMIAAGDPNRPSTLENLWISTRPFTDDAKP